MQGRTWKIVEGATKEAARLAEQLGISDFLSQMLLNRGIADREQAAAFLNPDLSRLHDPFRFKDMQAAVDRLQQAISRRERVLIYGDYDVDGVTSIALMIRVLAKSLPERLLYYIPKRMEEGYGLHLSSIEKALAKGVDLIITVDCGISAVAEAEYLRSKGIDLIITDHHEPQEELPQALAIINPKVPDSGYPFDQLAGVGVAFKLLQGAAARIPEISERLWRNLDLVALGTVADIVPLLDENRILVKHGLEQLQKTGNIGLQALIQSAMIKDRAVSCGHISYVLAPRINAAGRMGNPSIGVKLFLTNDPLQATAFAKELERENQNRQEIEGRVLQEAQAQIEGDPSMKDDYALVLTGENWHPGVIGIVASKLVDLYYKPVILIGFDGEQGRGSGRSIAGFNLFEALGECGSFLSKFGGHEFAAGLNLERARFAEFRQAFLRLSQAKIASNELQPVLKIESLIELNNTDLDLVREISKLAPCGTSNPVPVLACRSLNLVDFKSVGENGKHLKLRVSDKKVIRDAIGFNFGSVCQELAASKEVDLAFSVEENQWNGSTQVQLTLKDIIIRGDD